jgi:Zn-dependent peptidase ImmA (M78 family)/DNA-binding XRE family transcriptional regulator
MSKHILETIDRPALGMRLQAARKQAGLTQEDAAKSIDVARTTLVAIEKGERKLKPDELIRLARAYACDVSSLLRNTSVPHPEHSEIKIPPLAVQFRAAMKRSSAPVSEQEKEHQEILASIQIFENLCQKYQELEILNKSSLPKQYPPEYLDMPNLSIEKKADNIAQEERGRLRLGEGPIPFLRETLEQNVGLRIFYIPMPAKVSEMYFYHESLGGCMAINRNHPEDRRRWSMAHGYLHFLVHRKKAILDLDLNQIKYQRVPVDEQLAEAFPAYFLMPTKDIMQQFSKIIQQNGKFTPTDLFRLAHYYRVSLAALALRLEQLELLPTGTWDALKDRGLKVRETQRTLGIEEVERYTEMVPVHYQYLAIHAFEQGLITEGLFAEFLGLDRLSAREIAQRLYQEKPVHVMSVDRDLRVV